MGGRKKAKTSGKGLVDEAFGECHSILKFFMGKADAEAFLEPVDWKAFGLDDYPKLIKHPMDLGTINTKIENNKYEDTEAFSSDVRLVWGNAMAFNRPGSEIYKVADKYMKQFDKKWAKFTKQGAPAETSTPKTTKSTPKSSPGADVSKSDRIKFSQLVNQLNSDELEQLVKKIEQECPIALTEESDDELEIEINNINQATLTSLNAFCVKCIKRK